MKHTLTLLTPMMLALPAALLCLASVSAEDRKPVLIESKPIWDRAKHCAFTDLTPYRDQWAGRAWINPAKVMEEDQWLWRGDWHEGKAYGISYRKPIASMDLEHYDIALILPSGGSDTGYPGMVWYKDELWGSYYSSHEDRDGNPPPNRHVELPSAIYLLRVRLEK